MLLTESEPFVAQAFSCRWPSCARVGAGCPFGRLHDERLALRVEVDGGEVHLLEPVAVDRHRVRDDVDQRVRRLGALVSWPLTSGMRSASEIALKRILAEHRVVGRADAEDRPGHGPDLVDVEPLDLPVQGVQVAEVVGALVHPGDEEAALPDGGHQRAGGDRRRAGRLQAARVRVAGRRAGRGGRGPPPRRRPWPGRRPPAARRGRGAAAERSRAPGPRSRPGSRRPARPPAPLPRGWRAAGGPHRPERAPGARAAGGTGTPRAGGSGPRRCRPPSPASR